MIVSGEFLKQCETEPFFKFSVISEKAEALIFPYLSRVIDMILGRTNLDNY